MTTSPANEPNRRLVRSPRVSRGHVLMTVVGLAAAVLAFAALRTRPGDELVAVAKHQIRAGERVHRRDFRIASVSLGEAGLSRLVGAVDLRAVDGRIAGATIEPGELVPRRVLRPRAARGGLRAVGGRLAAGDRVDVLVADDDGVAIIVPDAEVLAVDARGRGGIGDSASPFTVTVAVDEAQSRLVAAAVVSGGLSLARTTGATPATGLVAADDSAARITSGGR